MGDIGPFAAIYSPSDRATTHRMAIGLFAASQSEALLEETVRYVHHRPKEIARGMQLIQEGATALGFEWFNYTDSPPQGFSLHRKDIAYRWFPNSLKAHRKEIYTFLDATESYQPRRTPITLHKVAQIVDAIKNGSLTATQLEPMVAELGLRARYQCLSAWGVPKIINPETGRIDEGAPFHLSYTQERGTPDIEEVLLEGLNQYDRKCRLALRTHNKEDIPVSFCVLENVFGTYDTTVATFLSILLDDEPQSLALKAGIKHATHDHCFFETNGLKVQIAKHSFGGYPNVRIEGRSIPI